MEEQQRGFRGIFIPASIWVDERLNALEKIILMEIDSLDNDENGCWASNEYLAKFCQCTATKISTAITKLKKLDYIELISFDGRHRSLKIKNQTLKNLKADYKNFKSINVNDNINNNIINNIIDKNAENNKPTTLEKPKKELTDKQKQAQKKAIAINKILNDFTDNKEIKDALKAYLQVRKKVGLDENQWKLILEDFRKHYGKRPIEESVEQIKKATIRSWRCLVYTEPFSGKPKTNYSSKPNFDNTKDHDTKIYHISDEEFNKLTHEEKIDVLLNKFSAVADMTINQKEFYNLYCVVHDWED